MEVLGKYWGATGKGTGVVLGKYLVVLGWYWGGSGASVMTGQQTSLTLTH